MKYETPELTALNSAINAIQASSPTEKNGGPIDTHAKDVVTAAYADWEE
jgi:hypothetical protein